MADIVKQDLNACYQPGNGPVKPLLLVGEPGLKVLYVNFAAGQGMPAHNHPGCHVIIQGMVGETTVLLDDELHLLQPQELLSFPGELRVSPHNAGTEPCAALITLVTRPQATETPV